MPTEVRRVRRKRRRRSSRFRWKFDPAHFTTIALPAVIVAAVALLALIYGPQAYRSWRESRLMRRATSLLEAGKYDAAATAARDALQIHPDSIPAFQVLAEASEKENKPETVAWRAQIARLLPDSLDSQLNLASAALRFGQLDVARRALDRVAPRDRDKAAFHVVAGWLAKAEGDDANVEEHFAAAVKQDPANDLYQFNLAVLEIRSPDPEKNSAGRTTLERLAGVGPYRAGSLRALLSDAIQKNDLGRADELAQELQLSQQVTFADYLLCLDFYRKLDEKKLTAVLERVKPVAAKNPGDLAMLMEWMNRNSLAQDVLRWMEKLPSAETTRPPAAIALAEAFAEIKNWSRLKRWTRNGSWGEADYLRLGYQAYATRQTRQSAADTEFDSLWRAADRAASEKPERDVTLARLAMKWNLTAEAEQLWLRVSKNSNARREALDALLKIYRGNNDLPNLYRTAQRLHDSSPNEPETTAAYARLGLLLDQNASDAQRAAKDAYERNPNSAAIATTYAFCLYSLGRTAEGIDVLTKLPEDELADPHLAVIAAVLLLDENKTDDAQPYVEIAREGPLYPEEKKLLDEATKKASATTPAAPPPSKGPAAAAPLPIIAPSPTTSQVPSKTAPSSAPTVPEQILPLPPPPFRD